MIDADKLVDRILGSLSKAAVATAYFEKDMGSTPPLAITLEDRTRIYIENTWNGFLIRQNNQRVQSLNILPGSEIVGASVTQGTLLLRFSNCVEITCPPYERFYEAWSIGREDLLVVCMARGKLAVWGS